MDRGHLSEILAAIGTSFEGRLAIAVLIHSSGVFRYFALARPSVSISRSTRRSCGCC
jgi:hypothetical protein